VWLGKAMKCVARQGKEWLGKARQGMQGKAIQGVAIQGKVGKARKGW
jgi:hypothetical protein